MNNVTIVLQCRPAKLDRSHCNGLLQRCGGHLEAQRIMGRLGGKTKTKMAETTDTRKELKTWAVPQLSRYLKDRGVAIGADGGRKDQLVEKVFYASLLALEVLPNENCCSYGTENVLMELLRSLSKNFLRSMFANIIYVGN